MDGPDYKGLVGDTQLSVRLAKPFVIRGIYVRDVRFSLWYGNPYYIESRPGVGASLYPLRFLRFDYDYSQGTEPLSRRRGRRAGREAARRVHHPLGRRLFPDQEDHGPRFHRQLVDPGLQLWRAKMTRGRSLG